MLLTEVGLIERKFLKSSTSDGAIATALARRLTWEGHEFLDKIRDPSMWGKIKSKVKEKGLDLTFDEIKTAAGVLIDAALSSLPS